MVLDRIGSETISKASASTAQPSAGGEWSSNIILFVTVFFSSSFLGKGTNKHCMEASIPLGGLASFCLLRTRIFIGTPAYRSKFAFGTTWKLDACVVSSLLLERIKNGLPWMCLFVTSSFNSTRVSPMTYLANLMVTAYVPSSWLSTVHSTSSVMGTENSLGSM